MNDRLKFDLYVGIDFGEAVVLENDDLRANTANLAARVSAKGPQGEVYFTEKVKNELHPREATVEEVGAMEFKGVAGEVRIYRLIEWRGEIANTLNPFFWRGGITRAEDFFDREEMAARSRCSERRRRVRCADGAAVGERESGGINWLLPAQRRVHILWL